MKASLHSRIALAALLAAGCSSSSDPGGATISLQATPAHTSMFGQVDVRLAGDFGSVGTVQTVTIDGIKALDVRPGAGEITVRVQGAPKPGGAHIVVVGSKGTATSDGAFSYDPPSGGAPATWAGFGASLTQGFQSGGLTEHSQTMSWSAQVARSAGVYLALPLVVDGFLPPIEPSAFAHDCGAMWSESAVASEVLGSITDPTTKRFDLRRARLDATLPTRNFAVGGALVSDVLQPASGPPRIIERIVELPEGDPGSFGEAAAMSQVDRLAALDPDVAISADLLANDSDPAVTQSDDLHPEQMTAVSTIASELQTLADRLGKLHGQYFIGNLLPLDGLPNVAVLRAQRLAAGTDTAQSFDAKVGQIRSIIQAYNQALSAAAAGHPNVHIVDLWTPTESVLTKGLDVGSTHLTPYEFGGLLSLDFVHFTDTGYAFMANLFIDAIDGAMGLHIAHVDVASVLAQDALSPASLMADDVHCTQPGTMP